MASKDRVLGSRIRELRKNKGLRQAELASLLHVSQQAVGSWETGRTAPGADTLNELADYFGVTTDYLLGRPEEKKETVPSDSDLDKMIDHARSFDGKAVTDHDREIIKAYLKGLYANKD
ncbi:helix-turn-helix domain-containing protein [Ligilactobacillus saerimneri]|uniref:Helix-turn-helix domain-containing protein n=1 Tax=Ligilactobacillus saerimneri TaxID=228229 RepID=A0A7H9EJD4_9LACO|nr:helix-turn-helix transcriptional regulator [Ligilactobacillus saerimneri]QLL77746.1 helix-turn-helix domain-containing protein [Ligilactobacillus saerimneri]